MARGFRSSFSGGRGGRSGGSRRGFGGRSSSSGTRSSSRSSGGRSSQPKGQVKSGKTIQYAIKGPRGGTKYIGTTNNPRRRAAEHRESGKLGPKDRLEVQSQAVPRKAAEGIERSKLASHRKTHRGRNPKHNTTNDGKFHTT